MSQSLPGPPPGYAHAPLPSTSPYHPQGTHTQQHMHQHNYQPQYQQSASAAGSHQAHRPHVYPPHRQSGHIPSPGQPMLSHQQQSMTHTQRTGPEGAGALSSEQHASTPGPISLTDEQTNRRFTLDVAQQPIRARMCGFGDKDRRPITPPPCVRLIITDLTTGKEIDPNEIEHSLFVLNVDLYNESGSREYNLVKSSTGSPSISSTTPFSYTALTGGGANDGSHAPYTPQILPTARDGTQYGAGGGGGVGYAADYSSQQGYAPVPSQHYSHGSTYTPAQQYFPHQGYRPEAAQVPSQAMTPYGRNMPPGYGPEDPNFLRVGQSGDPKGGMYTRNLIGSLAASAFKLHDTNDRLGIWFILQDLSVRTEGAFRLRFSFINVGAPGGVKGKDGSSNLNQGRAPVLASCFSEVFNVYSAKKFPGVCESTSLSKTFATQGIKIPIRKDTNVRGGGDDDDAFD